MLKCILFFLIGAYIAQFLIQTFLYIQHAYKEKKWPTVRQVIRDFAFFILFTPVLVVFSFSMIMVHIFEIIRDKSIEFAKLGADFFSKII